MGHKVNPVGLRVGINRTWDSRWYANTGEYGRLLHEDMRVRDHIMKMKRQAGISKVVIERPHKKCRVTVHTARPGVLIGKKGADIDKLRGQLAALTNSEVHLNVVEGAQAGDRRHADRRRYRTTARAPGRFSPGDEAGGAVGIEARCTRCADQLCRPPGRCGDRADRVVS